MNVTTASHQELLPLAHAQGRTLWPGVELSLERFGAAVAARGVTSQDLAAHGADLYLAIACGDGETNALKWFEDAFVAHVGQYLIKLRLADDVIDEVRQLVRIRMLAGPEPKLGLYSGRGALDAWIRILAVRTALNHMDSRKPDELRRNDGSLDALVDHGGSHELRYIQQHHRANFQAALDASLALLPARDKTLLRMSFVDGHSIDVIASIYRVHRATVARWLVSIRKQVLDDLRQRLSLDLQSTPSEARSLIKVMWGEAKVSVERLLAADVDPKKPREP